MDAQWAAVQTVASGIQDSWNDFSAVQLRVGEYSRTSGLTSELKIRGVFQIFPINIFLAHSDPVVSVCNKDLWLTDQLPSQPAIRRSNNYSKERTATRETQPHTDCSETLHCQTEKVYPFCLWGFIIKYLYSSAQITIIKCHTLDGLNNTHLFVSAPVPGKSKNTLSKDWFFFRMFPGLLMMPIACTQEMALHVTSTQTFPKPVWQPKMPHPKVMRFFLPSFFH